jgi:hypothetical protein
MFCALGLIFDGTEGVGSCFHVLRSRNRFQRYRGRPIPFSCFTRPDSISTIPRASGPIFMFCAPSFVFGSSEGVGFRFHVLRSRTRFQRCRVGRFLFSCFALPDSFSAVLRASCPVFMFCAPGIIFGGTEGVGSRFHVLRSRTCFRRYRGPRVLFSCIAFLNSFSAVPTASSPVFMFYAPQTHFLRYRGVGSRSHVLLSRTRFQRCRERLVMFSFFARPDSFFAVPRVSGPVFIFCAPASYSVVPRVSGPVFIFCAP